MEKLYWRWLMSGGSDEAKERSVIDVNQQCGYSIGRCSAIAFLAVSRAHIVGPAR